MQKTQVTVIDHKHRRKTFKTFFLGTITNTDLKEMLTTQSLILSALDIKRQKPFKDLLQFVPNETTRLVFKIVEGIDAGRLLITDRIKKSEKNGKEDKIGYTCCSGKSIYVEPL